MNNTIDQLTNPIPSKARDAKSSPPLAPVELEIARLLLDFALEYLGLEAQVAGTCEDEKQREKRMLLALDKTRRTAA